MNLKSILKSIAFGCLAAIGAVATPFAAASNLESVAPLLNDQTFAVLAVDAERLEIKTVFDKIQAWLAAKKPDAVFSTESIREGTNEIAAMRAIPEKWAQDFRQAGGREVYALAYAADGPQFILAVPLNNAGSREAMEALFDPLLKAAPLGETGKQMKGACLVMGNREAVDRLVSGKSSPRADLDAAFESQSRKAIKLVLAPTGDQRRVIREMLPTIPVGARQIPTTALTRGLGWCSLGIDLAPDTAVKAVFQASKGEPGGDLEAMEQFFMQAALALREEAAAKPVMSRAFGAASPLLERLLGTLVPVKEQARLEIALGKAELEDIFHNQIVPGMAQAKTRAEAIHSMNNAKQIALACTMFHNDKNAWPDRLGALLDNPAYLGNPRFLENPRRPGRDIGFEYLQPGNGYAKYPAAQHILIHEIYDEWPANGLCIGFLDGHAEIMVGKSRFEKLLAETKERNSGK